MAVIIVMIAKTMDKIKTITRQERCVVAMPFEDEFKYVSCVFSTLNLRIQIIASQRCGRQFVVEWSYVIAYRGQILDTPLILFRYFYYLFRLLLNTSVIFQLLFYNHVVVHGGRATKQLPLLLNIVG